MNAQYGLFTADVPLHMRQMVEKDIGFVGEVTSVDPSLLRVSCSQPAAPGGDWITAAGNCQLGLAVAWGLCCVAA